MKKSFKLGLMLVIVEEKKKKAGRQSAGVDGGLAEEWRMDAGIEGGERGYSVFVRVCDMLAECGNISIIIYCMLDYYSIILDNLLYSHFHTGWQLDRSSSYTHVGLTVVSCRREEDSSSHPSVIERSNAACHSDEVPRQGSEKELHVESCPSKMMTETTLITEASSIHWRWTYPREK